MPLFDYTGQLESGAAFQGTLEANSHERAQRTLDEMGVRVVELRPARRAAYVTPLSLDDFRFLNEQVAALTQGGAPLEEGLRRLASDVGSSKLKRALLELADELMRGVPLEAAVKAIEQRFPASYAGVVRAGLTAGDLPAALYALSAQLRLRAATGRALIELAAYPLVVLALALCVLTFMMRVLVPIAQETLEDMARFHGAGLDQLSGFVGHGLFALARYWWPIELALWVCWAAAVALLLSSLTPFGARFREALLSALPGFSQVFRAGAQARFAHATAIGAQAGLPLHELMRAGGNASGSGAMLRASRRAAERLEHGADIEEAVEHERAIPALWTCLVSVAGPRGSLPAALSELALSYESRAENWARSMRLILGPALLIAVGTLLGVVIVTFGLAFVRVLNLISSLTSF